VYLSINTCGCENQVKLGLFCQRSYCKAIIVWSQLTSPNCCLHALWNFAWPWEVLVVKELFTARSLISNYLMSKMSAPIPCMQGTLRNHFLTELYKCHCFRKSCPCHKQEAIRKLANQEDCEPKPIHQGEGQRDKNCADSPLTMFCLSDYGLWLHPCAEVKLFFLPCWATPKCFFDHHLGTALLTWS
jgi:hypothetical protein